ncbi:putative major facilitator superfamily protein [Magnetofaba australis IT-1]|uniref:Putative major facilitator superfamily protein n=2 Tax=Magnetofaba TaxID=1472292 RepID=A0A1Y2K6S1_9PROT|nr:putative major facilitator superfamily protein [Magnetofaba australis IT-1]
MLNLGLGLQASILGLRAESESFSVQAIGAVMAIYYVGFIIGSLKIPRLVDKVGHIRTFSVMASLASASVLLHAVWISPWSWALFRGITGFCLVGMSLVVESWLNEKARNEERGAVLSIYMMVLLGSTAMGQLLLTVASTDGYFLFVVVSVLLSLALLPLALSTRPTPVHVPTKRMRFGALMEQSPVGVIGALASGCMSGSFWTLGAVFAKRIGLAPEAIGVFMFCLVVGGLFSTWPIGRLSDRMDRRFVLIIQAALILLISVAMHWPGVENSSWIYPLAFLAGGAVLPVYAVSVALVNDQLKHGEFVPASATLLLVYGIGATLGPLLASTSMNFLGPTGLFSLTAVVALCVGLYAAYRLTIRAPLPSEELSAFIPTPRTTAAAYALHPDAEEDTAEEEATHNNPSTDKL